MKIEHNNPPVLRVLDDLKTTRLPQGLKIANTQRDVERVEKFREKVFRDDYPDLCDFHNDPHDPFSIIMFTENEKKMINSTGRVIFDNPIGFPADDYASVTLKERRQSGIKMVEAGRLAISAEANKAGLIKKYYEAFYALPLENGIDSVIVVINENHVKFYRNRLNADMLNDSIKNVAGSDFDYVCMEWQLNKTSNKFFKWVGLKADEVNMAPYPISTWNKYSQMFASIYTDYQRQVYQEAIGYLQGSVVDLGCGPARLAPLLADNENISQYIGIEYAQDMFEIAEFTMDKISKPSFKVLHHSVNDVDGEFDSAVSLLSYYAFPDPIETLKHTFEIMKSGSTLVLANPNEKMDQLKLQNIVEKEMMWHPDYELFRKYNLELADNANAEFTPMDELLQQIQSVGFEIITCHQKHYEGGLNFVVCTKPV